MKQDRNGVRTAQDLERKYDLSSLLGLKKAVEMQEEGINKTNAELEEFMATTLEDIENIHSQLDGQIHTYYYSGVPSMTTLPVTEWKVEEYNLHLGDLYYDKETGKAYKFVLDGDTNEYEWVENVDGELAEVLAIANAAKDTADSKRRVFVTRPNPPYDNGDLWLNNEEIYVCQVAKGEGETYAEKDFIIATKYTDDTLATQIGEELTVVKGQVTTITENQNGLSVTITETTNLVNDLTGEVADEIDERKAMLRYQMENGMPVVELGATDSPVKTKYKNDGMYIEDNGVTTGYFKNGKAYNHDMKVIKTFEIGDNFSFILEDDDSLSLV